MQLDAKLDRVFGLGYRTVLCEDENPGYIFTQSEWLDADPELVSKIAMSTRPEVVRKALHELAIEVGDESVKQSMKDPKRAQAVMAKAKPEAIKIMPQIFEKYGFSPEFLAKHLNTKVWTAVKPSKDPTVTQKFGLADENGIVREAPFDTEQEAAQALEAKDPEQDYKIVHVAKRKVLPPWVRKTRPEKFAFWKPEEVKRYFDELSNQYDNNPKLYNYAIFNDDGEMISTGTGTQNGIFTTKGEAREALKNMEGSENYSIGSIRKSFYGDQVFGIYDTSVMDDTENIPPKLVAIGPLDGFFESEADAEAELYGNDDAFPDPSNYMIMGETNPRSTGAIMNTWLPLSDTDKFTGEPKKPWTKEEVVKAMMPIIKKKASKYKSDKLPFEDLVQIGAMAVLHALKTDEGLSPFTAHANRIISRDMINSTEQSGTIKGARNVSQGLVNAVRSASDEDEENVPPGPGGFQQTSPAQGWIVLGIIPTKTGKPKIVKEKFGLNDEAAASARLTELKAKHPNGKFGKQAITGGSLASVDVPASDEGGTNWSQFLRATKTQNPEFIAQQRDTVKNLLQKARWMQKSHKGKGLYPLSPEQQQYIELMFGLDIPEKGVAHQIGPETEPEDEGGYHSEFPDLKKDVKDKAKWEKSKERVPGAQLGRSAEGVKSTPESTIDIPGRGKVPVERNPAEIAKLVGKDRKTVSTSVQKGLAKLIKMIEKEKIQAVKDILAKKATKEEIAFANKLLVLEDLCRTMLYENLIRGELIID
jgi:DNA-directed RNA polymerase specialized sigma24 family protein